MAKPIFTRKVREKIMGCLQDALSSLENIRPAGDEKEDAHEEEKAATLTPPKPNCY